MLGKRPVSEIQPMEVLLALRPIEKKGRHESAKRALNFIGQVFRYAVHLNWRPVIPRAIFVAR